MNIENTMSTTDRRILSKIEFIIILPKSPLIKSLILFPNALANYQHADGAFGSTSCLNTGKARNIK